MHMSLFDGSHSAIAHVLVGVPLFVGAMTVKVDLTVVGAASFEYLLGAPALVDMGARLDLQGHRLTMRTTPSDLRPGATAPSRKFQTLELYWHRKKIVLAMKPMGNS